MSQAVPRARRRDHQQGPVEIRRSRPWPLAITLGVAASAAVLLWRIAGPPTAVWRIPDLAAVRSALTATELSDGDLITTAATVAWLLLAYLTISIGLRALAVAADRATRGARWARTALRLTNLITVPAVRRIVDGGVAGTLLMATWMPVPRPADASHLTGVVALRALHAVEAPAAVSEAAEVAVRAPFIAYTVAPGEDLWGIAQRLYGDGARYVDLFRANEGRLMASGERFTDPRVIRTGWTLHAPLPASNVSVDAGHVTYRVARGDHLWGIAARFLGDGFRWDEIWAANRDSDMGGGWRFTDPQLIYPGWELVLPVEAMEGLSDVAPPAAAPDAAATGQANRSRLGRRNDRTVGPRGTGPRCRVRSS